MQTTSVMKTDSQIQQDVLQEFKWDTRVEETDVGVEVDEGVVTLTGTVSSYAKRIAAQEAAQRVAGVLDVVNNIHVHLSGSLERTDTDIAQAVRHALEWDVVVPEYGWLLALALLLLAGARTRRWVRTLRSIDRRSGTAPARTVGASRETFGKGPCPPLLLDDAKHVGVWTLLRISPDFHGWTLDRARVDLDTRGLLRFVGAIPT